MTDTTTTITESKPKGGSITIREQLQNPSIVEQIQRALPKHMDADRMARIAITALTRTPKLNQCTQASFFKCLLDLSAMGLEPDGRRAHLIPYGQECKLIIDYKGIVELAYRTGLIRSIDCQIVRRGDIFEFSLGQVVKHTPWAFRNDADRPKDAGECFAAYCVIQLLNGGTKCEVMTEQEIQLIRSRSRSGNDGPWVTDTDEMRKKTVFRRASKWIPLSAEIREAFEREDEYDSLAKPAKVNIKAQDIDLGDLISD